jgi:hypothetical protein
MMSNISDFSFMSKRLWLAVSGFIFFEVWISAGYLTAGKLTLGMFSTFWTLLTVLAFGNFYFERLDKQQAKPT